MGSLSADRGTARGVSGREGADGRTAWASMSLSPSAECSDDADARPIKSEGPATPSLIGAVGRPRGDGREWGLTRRSTPLRRAAERYGSGGERWVAVALS
ncbi:unnamed protein product [Arctia plantaginis]|uniref:Uncharacterized protein n=1 Tax=Arctia plantaginis TaxID=874455 RepID=A0A8S0ZMR1_ARCPL|nr:unnamed protein product [Arctia plantaginis]